mmetsp:Transcript_62359/g.190619  ORF Transcript_62359/g.190619 Transcript_62359/m.190619 type:complete len:281 (-) Transcript_62359:1796-2638(-)
MALPEGALDRGEKRKHDLGVHLVKVLLDGVEALVVHLCFQDVVEHVRGHDNRPPLDLHELRLLLRARRQRVQACGLGAVVAEDAQDARAAVVLFASRLLELFLRRLELRSRRLSENLVGRHQARAAGSLLRFVVLLVGFRGISWRRHHGVLPRRHRDLPERRGGGREAGAVARGADGKLHRFGRGFLALVLEDAVPLERSARDLVVEGDPLAALRRCGLGLRRRRQLAHHVGIFRVFVLLELGEAHRRRARSPRFFLLLLRLLAFHLLQQPHRDLHLLVL